ncbi:MAG: helix-turn-helix domain-containing protein [Clostridium butyricum]
MLDINEDFYDVEYTPVNEKTIRGTALYYSTSQVAQILNVSDSKIRFYTKEFDSLFEEEDIVISNTQKKYTQKAIDKLKYFIELKSEGFSIKQIKEYCQEVDWDEDKGIVIPDSTPLPIQAIATAIREETNKDMTLFKNDVLKNIEELLLKQTNNYNESIRNIQKEVSLTVDEVISDKLEQFKIDFIKEQKSEKEVTLKTMEMVCDLKSKMEERKKENTKKRFWNKVFK